MKLIKGLLNYAKPWVLPDIYIFTGNAIIKSNGALVMGRGAARQISNRYPGIDLQLGKMISRPARDNDYLLFLKMDTGSYLGWFKVKQHWADPADLNLIYESAGLLRDLAEDTPNYRYHMNYPGVGNGRLTEGDVAPILEQLPDNVLIYR